MSPVRRLWYPSLLLLAASCGGSPQATGGRPEPTTAEQTLTDLFNLTQLYQRMGRLAGGNPLPFVGNLVRAAKLGFSRFAGNFLQHLKAGLIDWPFVGSYPERF